MFSNRQFQPASEEMVHAASMGEHSHPTGRTQVIDEASCLAMELIFDNQSAQPNFPGLPVDFDHGSMDPKMPSQAAGWVRGLETRNDGLWARVAFTSLGDRMINDGIYRNVSPVFDKVQDLGNSRVRPLRLASIGLCNDPNIKGMTPLSNRRGSTTNSPMNNRHALRPGLIVNRAMPVAMTNRGGVISLADFLGAIQRKRGGTFEANWEVARPLVNRFSNRGHADTDALWREALTKEQAAFDATLNMYDTARAARKDRGGRLYKGVVQPRGAFLDGLLSLMDNENLDFAQAWAQLRDSEPWFFVRHVWAMTDPRS